ncbi:hypothetical protein HFP15_35365 [Amycolatopsis sp. K13G38]|uniref:Nuclear transport factor 2 family protein n=1 Tax=Amycolatopsis acididurans TaxID=2724524 RepID=A0ABX1JED0_9PSEU|nr:hypothetical protein [Amycolatopsis acididurans]NKQ58152.1 hypothetical protein [Amycolatopsis acididurans]
MRVAHDRRRSRHPSDAITVEDLLSGHVLDVEPAEIEQLAEPVRAPRDYLPPPRLNSRRAVAPPREPESRLSKVAKLAGLTTAASLLVGAVVASSMLTRERPAEGRPSPAPPQITGAAALAGFVPADEHPAQYHGKPGAGGQPAGQGVPAASSASQPVSPPAADTAPASQSAATTSATPRQLSDAERIKVVREFYQRMGSQHPQDALAMLAPGLAGDEPGDLVRAWSSMRDIHVDDVQVQPDGTVRAVATMRQQDNTRLRVTQVFSLASDADGIISQAVLLSAQQL